MTHLEMIHKLSVLHCAYQLIASADGAIDEERDYPAIELVLNNLNISIHSWDSAMKMIPHDCFFHISTLSDNDKASFKTMMLQICEMGGNREFRINCAKSLFQLCQI